MAQKRSNNTRYSTASKTAAYINALAGHTFVQSVTTSHPQDRRQVGAKRIDALEANRT